MTDQTSAKPYVWKNPLAVWGTATGNLEAPSIRVPDPRGTWGANTAFELPTPGRPPQIFSDLIHARQPNLEPHPVVADAAQPA